MVYSCGFDHVKQLQVVVRDHFCTILSFLGGFLDESEELLRRVKVQVHVN